MNDYGVNYDIQLIKELRNYSDTELAKQLGVSRMTVNRWLHDSSQMSDANISAFYEFSFSKGVKFNRIYAQLMKEEYENSGIKILFHGSKNGIDGAVDLSKTSERNDFGRGFYCGESLEQSAMFVSPFPRSSLYIVKFDTIGLNCQTYAVDRDWMLTIALFRGRLAKYLDHPEVLRLKKRLVGADYIIAPIADNRMFDLIDEFADGQISDVQCQHCLSATDLGAQYVLVSEKAVNHAVLLRHRYLSAGEKEHYLERRSSDHAVSMDKVKAAKRTYRNQGKYIDEILK